MGKAKQKKSGKGMSERIKALPWVQIRQAGSALSLAVVALWGAYLGLAWLKDPSTLPLQLVRIEGEFNHLDRHALEQVVADEVRGGFFSVDVEAVRTAVRILPWVEEVAVRRVWPDTLRIWVAEQRPLARWGERGLVNTRGEIFWPAVDEIPSGLPGLVGPEGTEAEMAQRYLELQQQLRPLGLQVVRLQQNARGAWLSEFDNGAVIKLGSRDLDIRFRRFVRLYPRLKAAGKGMPKQVDLRYTNGLVVHWGVGAESGEPPAAQQQTTNGNGLA
jgi:cell division protein FtsQ